MNRCFLSNNTACHGGCLYCFSKWQEYKKFELQSLSEDNNIIYPNCDGDMFDGNFRTILKQLQNISQKYSISISTKFAIDERNLQLLKLTHNNLQYMKKGIAKLSVSFSCSNSIRKIEPGTADYEKRISLVKKIFEAGIPYVTIIKPILPFIESEEYYRIVDDTIEYSPYYLIGDLYISESTDFYKKFIKNRYETELKNVNWNGKNGPWRVVIDMEKRKNISDYIISKGGMVFESDEAVMKYLVKAFENKECKENE